MAVTNGHDTVHIPVIDISSAKEQVGHELLDAVVQYGFVFIKSSGLGLDAQTVNQMFDIVSHIFLVLSIRSIYDIDIFQSRKFFQSPREEKQKYRMEKNVVIPMFI